VQSGTNFDPNVENGSEGILPKHNPTLQMWTAVAQWLRCCSTNQKVAGSIPAGVIGIFH